LVPARKIFHFSIQPTVFAWCWQAMDSAGVVIDTGLAPSRKSAAACVIRALARAAR
jgi:transposase-like protein